MLFESTDPAAIRQGSYELRLPFDAPPTFVAYWNQLNWSVVVHGDIPQWLDIHDAWEREVQPPGGPIGIASPALWGDPTHSALSGEPTHCALSGAPTRAALPGDATRPAPSADAATAADAGLAIRLSPSASGRVEGHVTWKLPAPPGGMELCLFWYTSGRGASDLQIVARQVLDAGVKQGEHLFRMTLPPGPRPFAGKRVTVTWALELVPNKGERFVRLDLPVTPPRAG